MQAVLCLGLLEPDDLVLAVEDTLWAADKTDETLLSGISCLCDQGSPALLLVILLESDLLESLLCLLWRPLAVEKSH